MSMRERANDSNIVDEFDGILFYDMRQKYFVLDRKYFVVIDIYFFVYNVPGEETSNLCST